MKKSLLYLICCFICFSAFSQASDLKFRDGKFKIVQLTDLHWVESDSYKLKNDSTCHLIREVIRIEDPDLVVLTGDVVVSWNAKKGWEKLTKIFGETKTPFVVTFGNHDEETDMNNAQILDYLCTRPYNLTSNFCNVRSHRIRGWLMSMSYRFYAIPRSGILFRLSKYYNFILALSNLQCKAFATSSRSFGICYNSPIFFSYNFHGNMFRSAENQVFVIPWHGKRRQYSAPLHSHVSFL